MCRRRKKKCDGTKPACNACVRLKLDCEYQQEPVVWQILKLRGGSLTMENYMPFSGPGPAGPALGRQLDKPVLNKAPPGPGPALVLEKTQPRAMAPLGPVPALAAPALGRDKIKQAKVAQFIDESSMARDLAQGLDLGAGAMVGDAVPGDVVDIGRLTPLTTSPWSISNLFMGEELYSPSLLEPSTGTSASGAGAITTSATGTGAGAIPSTNGVTGSGTSPLAIMGPSPPPRNDSSSSSSTSSTGTAGTADVKPLSYFKANITSEVYLTYDTNVSHSLWGHRFVLPKFVSVESAEILLSYFCDRMAPLFSVCRKHSSSLVCTYLPLAAYDTMVLVALLAWASLHFEQRGHRQFLELKQRLLREVHVLLDKMIKNKNGLPVEVALATLMIMISIENKGTTSNWHVYYKMAQQALKGANLKKDTETFKWLKNNMLYHEVTGPSLLTLDDPAEDLEEYFGAVELDFDDVPEAYMGICRTIYSINRDIFKLSRKLVLSVTVEVLEDVCVEAERLEERIEACRTLEPTEEMVLNGTIKYHRLFFEVLKDTSRLYIRQCVYMVAPVSIKSTMFVGRIMNTIKKLFGTIMDPALLFPLFILGVDTVTKNVRDWVITEMKELHKRVGSGNILVAIELLYKIWGINEGGRVHVLWPQVAKDNGMMISLA